MPRTSAAQINLMKSLKLFSAGLAAVIISLLACGCATTPPQKRDTLGLEQGQSNRPWFDFVLGSGNVTEQQMDEMPWWKTISAWLGAFVVGSCYETARWNSERESR